MDVAGPKLALKNKLAAAVLFYTHESFIDQKGTGAKICFLSRSGELDFQIGKAHVALCDKLSVSGPVTPRRHKHTEQPDPERRGIYTRSDNAVRR